MSCEADIMGGIRPLRVRNDIHRARTNRRAIFILICWLVLGSSGIAHDSEPINTDFASPLASHSFNLNFDVQHFRRSSDEDIAAIGFEYGVARRMQLSLVFPMARHVRAPGQSVVGAGNLSLEYRYLLAGGNEKPFAISINPEVEFPTGNPGVADAAYSTGAALHFDAHRGEKLWLHSNWGYATSVAHFAEKEKNFNFAVAGMYELVEHWHSVIEVFGHRDFNASGTEIFVAPEIIRSLGEHWELKAAVPIGASSATPAVGVQFRVTWKFGPSERQ